MAKMVAFPREGSLMYPRYENSLQSEPSKKPHDSFGFGVFPFILTALSSYSSTPYYNP